MYRRFVLSALAVMIVLASLWGFGGTTRASAQNGFTATSDCWVGRFTVPSLRASFMPVNQQRAPDVEAVIYVSAVDAEGTFLGDYSFFNDRGGNGVIWYASIPVDSVTFTLYLVSGNDDASFQGEGHRSRKLARPATQGLSQLASITVPVDCFEAAAGCDLGMVPEGSVVGQFVTDATAHWAPGQLVSPLTTLPAGKTAWVIGLDVTREYYKVVWSCNYLWVETDLMRPNPDALWQSTPLPMRTVE